MYYTRNSCRTDRATKDDGVNQYIGTISAAQDNAIKMYGAVHHVPHSPKIHGVNIRENVIHT
jgi:hypothetical protein